MSDELRSEVERLLHIERRYEFIKQHATFRLGGYNGPDWLRNATESHWRIETDSCFLGTNAVPEGFDEAIDAALGAKATAVKDTIAVSGITLRRDGLYGGPGNHVVVEVELNGKWVEIIREPIDATFSHIVEPLGIRHAAGLINCAVDRSAESSAQ